MAQPPTRPLPQIMFNAIPIGAAERVPADAAH